MSGPKLRSSALLVKSSTAIAKNFIDASRAPGGIAPEDCPWVQIGSVYVSITITGQESWRPLIRLLRERGRKHFVVYTGRHGSIVNRIDMKKKSYGVLDHRHYDEDETLKAEAIDEMPDIGIQLVDTSQWAFNHTATLKQHTKTQFSRGVAVIYAWCHSLFTFCEEQLGPADIALEALRPNLVYNGEGQIVKPARWLPGPNGEGQVRNAKFADQEMAYKRAQELMVPIIERDEGPDGTYDKSSNRSIATIVFKHFLWVPC